MSKNRPKNSEQTRLSKPNSSPSPPGRGWRAAPGEGREQLHPQLLAFARHLRRELTDAERLLWSLLRNRRFYGLKFRRQHPLGSFVLDFYCHEAKLAVELDGGQHNRPEKRFRDERRTSFLKKNGIKVARFWNHEVLQQTESVLCSLLKTLTPTLSQRERELMGSRTATRMSTISLSQKSLKPDPLPSLHGSGWRVTPGEGQQKSCWSSTTTIHLPTIWFSCSGVSTLKLRCFAATKSPWSRRMD